eukprot:Nitzschia sp. Nitz4//scaffold236_size30323//1868//4159//NITZ4_007983-RA/size30323-processed-gene-0.11-mRNA-1//1//CDS//3329543478//143//frame0
MKAKRNKSRQFSKASKSPEAQQSRNEFTSVDPLCLPPGFPSALPRPKDDFLRNHTPYKESFQKALETAYEGFVVDASTASPSETHIQECLEDLRTKDFFRWDITQPFGLGTKCAKTYVTRCLLGEPGTTYKYLGLRMFSHPWKGTAIGNLAETLTERTKHHLRELDGKRRARGAPETRGRPEYDICLINRMEASDDLKEEPSLGTLKTTVSWHADSSLEHYSTIAVYQTLLTEKSKVKRKGQEPHHWQVALRVAHHAEGPQASRQRGGIDTESTIVKESPPIATSLPSGSTYYMLDDFNHHHQHTVLTEPPQNVATGKVVRYSCTFRLLRQSHNVNDMLQWCQSTVSNFHKKGAKIWRAEQLVLSELESEWLRQFYIQGSQHYEMLCASYWHEPIQKLLCHWIQLEQRTKQVLDLLRHAAEGRCTTDDEKSHSTQSMSRLERKEREKRKKAVAAVQGLLNRSENGASMTALDTIYEPLAVLLDERATMRELWTKREKDHVFAEQAANCRPLPLPFVFEQSTPNTDVDETNVVSSPLPGTPEKLRELAKLLRSYGKAWESQNPRDLPQNVSFGSNTNTVQVKSAHSQLPEWPGWGSNPFGLELQDPWASAVVEGRKMIETRSYDLPHALIGKKVWIIQTPSGKAGQSSMGNEIDFEKSQARIIGWCTFKSVVKYTDKRSFQSDEKAHLVTVCSGYGWKDGVTKVIFGWEVGDFGPVTSTSPAFEAGVRRMRSLFQLRPAPKASKSKKRSSGNQEKTKNKRKKRY